MDAETYMKHWEKNKVWTHLEWPKHQRRFKIIASFLKGETFIDVGCAYGHSTKILNKLKAGKWAGLDFSPTAINEARRLFKGMVFYHVKNFDFLSICGYFDSVVCSEVIEHVKNDKDLIKGLLEITRRVLVITTPCVKVNDPGHLRIYTKEMLEELFKGMEFDISQDSTFFYVKVKS